MVAEPIVRTPSPRQSPRKPRLKNALNHDTATRRIRPAPAPASARQPNNLTDRAPDRCAARPSRYASALKCQPSGRAPHVDRHHDCRVFLRGSICPQWPCRPDAQAKGTQGTAQAHPGGHDLRCTAATGRWCDPCPVPGTGHRIGLGTLLASATLLAAATRGMTADCGSICDGSRR